VKHFAWLALDVGGANLKAAHGDGWIRTVPFQVWKKPEELGMAIACLAASAPAFDRVALTMTAELCDCYPTKRDGVASILTAATEAVGDRPVSVWGIDGQFHEPGEIQAHPGLAAAANWLALATVAARLAGEDPGILIDIGSTTTDLIPLDRGNVAARGRTDRERLTTGELVYAGVRRTPVCALANKLPIHGGESVGLAAELFATTLDVFLMLGDIEPDPTDLSTADGRAATVENAHDRLARMVGADRHDFSLDDAQALARSVEGCLMNRLAEAAGRACRETIGTPQFAIVAGSGEFLARRLALAVLGSDHPIRSAAEAWGQEASTAGCAWALRKLASEWQMADGR
jgi:(4-(4-[2-(gamma-L-glutamylamino)ethyl]phenoxymethyl)furan-2-yl)methanamine synthase